MKEKEAIINDLWHILRPEGKLLVIGFNPYSFLGLFASRHGYSFSSPYHLQKQFLKQGFEVIKYKTFLFRPPSQSVFLLKNFAFLEIVGQVSCPHFGGLYSFLFKKTVLTLTSVRTRRQVGFELAPREIAPTSSRGV
jgi:hypothetical protein